MAGDWGLGTGDWGLGTGDWELGTGDWARIPNSLNPQSLKPTMFLFIDLLTTLL